MSATAKRDIPKRVQRCLAEDDDGPLVAEPVSAPTTRPPKFHGVVYLAKPGMAFPEREMRDCERYADTFGWGITLTIVDEHANDKGPDERPLLKAALQNLKDRKAGAILVPSQATITPIGGEYDEFARAVEKAGGFIQVAARK
ncbi:hypothetical protein ACFWXO_07360 [Kitasatospora sp. NPDC059088]|uniref:hypothetical protein n=1 Tax=Kitasatospora sp. NPDC059088 TaxID=3346722 RepID=UPI0036A0401A